MADNDRHEGTFEVSDSMDVDGTPVKLVYTRIREPREPLGDDELRLHALAQAINARVHFGIDTDDSEEVADHVLKAANKFYEWLKGS